MGTLKKLQGIMRDVFDDEGLTITPEMGANDIEGWDSLAQINIIVACENAFGIKFDMADIEQFTNISRMIALIEGKK